LGLVEDLGEFGVGLLRELRGLLGVFLTRFRPFLLGSVLRATGGCEGVPEALAMRRERLVELLALVVRDFQLLADLVGAKEHGLVDAAEAAPPAEPTTRSAAAFAASTAPAGFLGHRGARQQEREGRDRDRRRTKTPSVGRSRKSHERNSFRELRASPELVQSRFVGPA